MELPDYYKDARAYETLFRAVLKDLKFRFAPLVPEELNPRARLDDIFEDYSDNRFRITDFRVDEDILFFGFEGTLDSSIVKYMLKYHVNDDLKNSINCKEINKLN